MSAFAVRLTRLRSGNANAPERIHAQRDGLHVSRIDAPRRPTQMINDEAGLDLSDRQFIRQAVSKDLSTVRFR